MGIRGGGGGADTNGQGGGRGPHSLSPVGKRGGVMHTKEAEAETHPRLLLGIGSSRQVGGRFDDFALHTHSNIFLDSLKNKRGSSLCATIVQKSLVQSSSRFRALTAHREEGLSRPSVGLFSLFLHPISPTHFAIHGAFPLPPPFCARGTLQARETGVGGGGGGIRKEEEEEGTRDKPPPSEFVWGILELESGRGLLRSHSFFFASLVPFLFQTKTSLPLPFFPAPIQDAFEGHEVFPTIDFCNKQ